MQNILEEVSPIVKSLVDATTDLKSLRDSVALSAGRQAVAIALARAAAERETAELQTSYDKLIDSFVVDIISGRAVTRRSITFRLRRAGVSESAIAGVVERLILLHHRDLRMPRVTGIRARPLRKVTQISIAPAQGGTA